MRTISAFKSKMENKIVMIIVLDMDMPTRKANRIKNGSMDAKWSANSARTVTTLTNITSVRSCLKTVHRSMRTENAPNARMVTILIGTINVLKSMIANKITVRNIGGSIKKANGTNTGFQDARKSAKNAKKGTTLIINTNVFSYHLTALKLIGMVFVLNVAKDTS